MHRVSYSMASASPGLSLDERDFGFADSGSMSTDAFARYVREEIAKWAKVVKASGATAD